MNAPLSAGAPLAPRPASPHPTVPSPGSPPPPKRPRRPFRRWGARIAGGLVGLVGLAIVGSGIGAYVIWTRISADLPSVEGLRGYAPPVMSRVYASNGQLMEELASERRIFVPFAAIPVRVRQAFVSAEDKDYWSHGGVDLMAIIRAGLTDIARVREGRRPIGASTITQQVAKNMLLNNRITLKRKIEEAILAIRMEQVLSKERILELYLNEIYLGQGAYGVQAAAQAYFNRPLDQLTLAQDAMLAALPKAPHNYNPFRNPDQARIRRDWVLDRMAEDHDITPAEAAAAKAEPLVPSEFRGAPKIPGGDWFAEEVRQQLVQRFGAQTVNEGGLTIRTSLDPALQTAAETAVRDGLMNYDRRMGGWRGPVAHVQAGPDLAHDWARALANIKAPAGMLSDWRLAVVLSASAAEAQVGWIGQANAEAKDRTGILRMADNNTWHHPMNAHGRIGAVFRRMSDMVHAGDVVMVQPTGPGRALLRQIPKVQGALVSLDPTTGRVLAMVGGWSFAASQFNRATQAERQPGSSFKPFVFLAALEKGTSPSDRFNDDPLSLPDGRGGLWQPHNFESGEFPGAVSLRIALEQSLNLATIRVAQHAGIASVAKVAEAFGMTDKLPHVLAAALGAADTTVIREAGAYASIDELGRHVIPTLIDSVQDREGHVVWRPPGLNCACDSSDGTPTLQDQRPQIADPQSTFQLLTMMQGVVTHGTGTPAAKGLNRPIAGKTGTSQNFNDAWFSGFTPRMVTTVWVGYDTPATLGHNMTGAEVAAPIWNAYMTAALKNVPPASFPVPQGVTLASWESSRGTVTDAFKPDQVPGRSAPLESDSPDLLAGAGSSAQAIIRNSAPGVDTSLGGLY